MIKELGLQEAMAILSVHAPNNTASKYVRQKMTELWEIYKFIIRALALNIPLSGTDRSSKQKKKISKDRVDLNITINHLHLIDIYKILHVNTMNTHSC